MPEVLASFTTLAMMRWQVVPNVVATKNLASSADVQHIPAEP